MNMSQPRRKQLLLLALGIVFLLNAYKTLSLASLLRSGGSGSQIDQFVVFASLNVLLLYALLIAWRGIKEGIESASTIAVTFATVVVAVFAWLQIHQDIRDSDIERTAKWGRLRNTMWRIMDMCPKQGVVALNALPSDQKVQWLREVRVLLDSEIDNPVLISNKKCLGHWRNAISASKTDGELLAAVPTMFEANASSILKDVLTVWQDLVLDSGEVSATGGRPKETK